MGNVVADETGKAEGPIDDHLITGPYSVIGRSIMAHADEDDPEKGGHE